MKTISIGDIHGRDYWKSINPDEYDKIIFVGDYTDSFVYPDIHILNNLLDIIAFKENYPDKVVLLLGNHDTDNYMVGRAKCSGFRSEMYSALNKLFKRKENLFDLAFGIKTEDFEYLWTHAGIHSGWYKHRFYPTIIDTPLKEAPIYDQLNSQFRLRNNTLFDVGHLRGRILRSWRSIMG